MNSKSFPQKLFNLLLIFLPLIIWKGYYEAPKVFIFLILGFFLATFWIYRSLFKRQPITLNTSDIFYLSWLLIMVVSSVIGLHPLESIIGGSYRHQGVLFFFTLWLVNKTIYTYSIKQKAFLEKGLGLVVLVESIIVFLQYSKGALYFNKPLGTIGEANAVAGYLAIGSYYIFKYFPVEYFALPIISILIAESKTGVLSVLPNLFVIARNTKPIVQKMVALILVLLGTLVFIVAFFKPQISDVENRQNIWEQSIHQISIRPILGFGAETGEVIFNNIYSKAGVSLENLVIDRSHNLFLDILMWSGGVGLIFFIGFLVTKFNILDKYKKYMFLSFLIYSMFQPLSIVHWLLFFLL